MANRFLIHMKRYAVFFLLLRVALTSQAQEWPKFSPEKFEADLEAFITREAKLTEKEAAKFFPLNREMHQKQRAIYGRIGKLFTERGTDDKACARVIRESDRLNVELREIEQRYHEKMMHVIPASKVSAAIEAENRFHRQMMRGWGGRRGSHGAPWGSKGNGPNGKQKDTRR